MLGTTFHHNRDLSVTLTIRFSVLRMICLLVGLSPLYGISEYLIGAELRIAIVQRSIAPQLAANREAMIQAIDQAAGGGARVVVFPEGSLSGNSVTSAELLEARRDLAQAARRRAVYLIYGEIDLDQQTKNARQALTVIDPHGQQIYHYVKHYDQPTANLPGTFLIDGIPCAGIICADRWLRTVEELPIQQGARISFELSANYSQEWVGELGWYWYVPRAIRNGCWVVFANSAENADTPGHGHSALIAPDGTLVASFPDNRQAILWARIDLDEPTGEAAAARLRHPVVGRFWKAGLELYQGRKPVTTSDFSTYTSSRRAVVLGAASAVLSEQQLERVVSQAARRGVQLLALPTLASRDHIAQLQRLARDHRLAIASAATLTSASHTTTESEVFLIGPEGDFLVRRPLLSQVDRWTFEPSLDKIVFVLDGVPGILLAGEEIQWAEVIELAAVAGAQLLVHVDDPQPAHDRQSIRLQQQAVAASYGMFSVFAGATGATIWEDLNPRQERRAVINDMFSPRRDDLEIYSPFSANLIARMRPTETLIVARRELAPTNGYFQDRVARFPELASWLRWGAAELFPGLVSRATKSGREKQ